MVSQQLHRRTFLVALAGLPFLPHLPVKNEYEKVGEDIEKWRIYAMESGIAIFYGTQQHVNKIISVEF